MNSADPDHVEREVRELIGVAPLGYRNWLASAALPSTDGAEYALYSDARFEGHLHGLGPYSVINTVAWSRDDPPGTSRLALVLRADFHVPRDSISAQDLETTRVGAYHGGWLTEEIAALLTLAANVRVRAGGIVRYWDGTDPLGTPIQYEAAPYLPAPRAGRAPILPGLPEAVDLEELRDLLRLYPAIPAGRTGAFVRAARQYQSALWGVEGDPNLAWLQLVAALEAAATALPDPRERKLDLLREAWPAVAELIDHAEPEPGADTIGQLYRLVKAGLKVRRLLERYPPPPPEQRPDDPFEQVDWTRINDLVMKVYAARSSALHEGIPMPQPMCSASWTVGGPVAVEGAISTGYGGGEGTWSGAEIPMHIHVFAHVVRTVLIAWWRDLGSRDASPEGPPAA